MVNLNILRRTSEDLKKKSLYDSMLSWSTREVRYKPNQSLTANSLKQADRRRLLELVSIAIARQSVPMRRGIRL